jgi:type VI protein secretion system component Hcp
MAFLIAGRNAMDRNLLFATAILAATSLSGGALAKGSGGSHTHSDITIKKQVDTASPKMMSAKPGKKMKPSTNRLDPYKNYNFR